jgi:hypothetical protein
MEGTGKLHMDKYKEVVNDWNFNASCVLTSLPVMEIDSFLLLIFVVWNVPIA